jgi:hypothetical protein
MNFPPTDQQERSQCPSRRSFLRLGSPGLGGLLLGALLRLRAEESTPRTRSVIRVDAPTRGMFADATPKRRTQRG